MTAYDDEVLEIPRPSRAGIVVATALALLLLCAILAATLQVSGAYAGERPARVVCVACGGH